LKPNLKKLLPPRRPDSHKGNFGRALIIAGSSGMAGAAILASRGALRVGAGLTYLALPKDLVNVVNSATPEVITLSFDNLKRILPDAVGIGPGLGVSATTRELIKYVLEIDCPVIADADALNVLAANLSLLSHLRRCQLILTPHPGEMARLLRQDVASIQHDRRASAKKAAQMFNAIVVLKGHRTIVADPTGQIYVNGTGNPGMAKGGTGDVLTGIMTGLAAQKIKPWSAACAATYLHGLAGDLAAKEKGQVSMIASDIIEQIPNAI